MILSVILCHVYPTKHEFFTHICHVDSFLRFSIFLSDIKMIWFFFAFSISYSCREMWLSAVWFRREKKKKQTSPIISFLVDSLLLGSPTYYRIFCYISDERAQVLGSLSDSSSILTTEMNVQTSCVY